MKTSIRKALCISIFILTGTSYADECSSACQLEQIKTYFSFMDAINRKGAKPADIDGLLENLHDEVTYEHVKFGVKFGKNKWKSNANNRINKGFNTNDPNDKISILNSIYGHNYVAIEFAHGYIDSKGVWNIKSDSQLGLFKFKDGKIVLIQELW